MQEISDSKMRPILSPISLTRYKARTVVCAALLLMLVSGDALTLFAATPAGGSRRKASARKAGPAAGANYTFPAMAPVGPRRRPGRQAEPDAEPFKPWRGSLLSQNQADLLPQEGRQPDRMRIVRLSRLPDLKTSPHTIRIVPAPENPSIKAGGEKQEAEAREDLPAEIDPPLTPRSNDEGPGANLQNAIVPTVAPTQVIRAIDSDGFIPPDTQGAVGPNHLVSAANGTLRVQTRAGVITRTVSLQQFTQEPTAFDPRVIYDRFNNHFILIALARPKSGDSFVILAWTQTGDPNDTWQLRYYDADQNNVYWADFPRVGLSQDRIILTWTAFPIIGGDPAQRIWVWNSSGIYSQADFRFFFWIDAVGTRLVPAYAQETTSDLWIASAWNQNFNGQGILRVGRINGAFTTMTYATSISFPASSPWVPIDPRLNYAPQLGSSTGLNIGDASVANVVLRNGFLWCVQSVLTAANPQTSGLKFWQISPASGSVPASRVIFGLDYWMSHPSIAVNRNNEVLIGASYFKSDSFPSALYWYKPASSAAFEGQIYLGGEAPYIITDDVGRNRWGDYSSTVVDPVDDTSFWTIQEYARSATSPNIWGTGWAKVGGSPEGGSGAPRAPSNLVATDVKSTELVLRWTDNSDNEVGFRFEFFNGSSWQEFGTGEANSTSIGVVGLGPDTTYRFRIRAYNSSGNSEYSNEVSVRTTGGIAAPTGLFIKKLKKKKVVLAWTDAATNETRYEILQRNGATSNVIGTLSANAKSVTLTNLQRFVTYIFGIRACNASGCSNTTEISVTVP